MCSCNVAATNQPIKLQDLDDERLLIAAVDCTISPAPPWLLVRPSCPPCHTCCLAASSRHPRLHAEKDEVERKYY